MNFPAHLEEMTAWYCHLVKQPGWRDYVLHRVEYMAERQLMYQPLLDAVKAAAPTELLNPGTRSSRR